MADTTVPAGAAESVQRWAGDKKPPKRPKPKKK